MEDLQDMALDMVEYLAVLVSPSPKDTMKAIEKRRKADAIAKKRAGQAVEDDGDLKLFKNDHRNTTFYDEIAKMAGGETADALKKEFDAPDEPSIEQYELDLDDLEFIRKAQEQAEEAAQALQQQGKEDSIQF